MISNPTGQSAIEADWYRLDAICRHCEQLVAQRADKAHRAKWDAEHFPDATAHYAALTRLADLRTRLRAVGWTPRRHFGDPT